VRVGRERLRQILHARGISFQRTRTWKESHDPDRDAKLDRIEYVTSSYPDRCFAFDQFGPLSIRPCHGACWAGRKKPVRLRATYHRTHGIRYFHGCYSLGDDQLWGVVREHKGADHTLAALKSIRAARPGGYRLFVILDNLAANKTPAIRRWARRENVELCVTPTNASWANPVEAQFGPLRTFVMGGSDHPSHTVLARKLHAYLRWRNAHDRHPGVLAAQPPRARPRPQRTPATLGPPEAPPASRMTNLANVGRQRTRRAGSRGVPAAGYVDRRRPSAPNLRRPAPAGSPDGGKGRPTSRPGRHWLIVRPPQRSLGDPRTGRGRRS
jgi:hypothetical protein